MQACSGAGPVSAVVLLTVDSLRADELQRPEARTVAPTLAGLADRGCSFVDAHATGNWTPFSFPAILGSRPVFAGGEGIGVGRDPTLAEHLDRSGVATAGVNAGNGFLTPHWGYDRGFETFTDCLDGGVFRSSRLFSAHPTVQAWLGFLATPARRLAAHFQAGDRSPAENASRLRTAERAAAEVLRTAEPPLFCWLHLMDCHTPYVPCPEHVRKVAGDTTGYVRLLRTHAHSGLGRPVGGAALRRLRTLYRAGLAQLDEAVARLLGVLEDRGLRRETAIILAGDHGEEFQEHGHLAHYPKLYNELTNVPFVVHAPGGRTNTVSKPVSLAAVPPTVCDLLGIEPAASFAGRSLWPTVARGDPPAPEPVLSVAVRGETVTQQPIPRSVDAGDLLVSARDEQVTYIHHSAGRDECYDRLVDPGEQLDLVANASMPAGAGSLRTTAVDHAERLLAAAESPPRSLRRQREDIEAMQESMPASDPPSSPGEDSASTPVERQLEALGYR